MNDVKGLVVNLLGGCDISSMTAEDFGGNISLNLYKPQNSRIRDQENFDKLPDIIKDIILIIDFDTELNINGILGFLENSTGLYLDETIKTLKRIEAYEDCEILENIQKIMLKHGVSTKYLTNNLKNVNHYDITSFSKTHGSDYDIMANEIGLAAEGLYLYQDERNIFTNLLKYIDINKNTIVEYLKDI